MRRQRQPGMSERYQRQIGRIAAAATTRALTDGEVRALHAFYMGMLVAQKAYERRYPSLPLGLKVEPVEGYDPDEMGDGFPVGNHDPNLRGLHLGTSHPDREPD